MALTNALLVRYQAGYRWVTDATSIALYGRREGYLALGTVASPEEADRVGQAVLADAATPSMAIVASVEPSGPGDTPYDAFAVGDTISVPDENGFPQAMRTLALTVTEDDLGNPTFVPELNTLRDERERVLQRWLKRMANGTLGGSVESAAPPAPPGASQAPAFQERGQPAAASIAYEAPPFDLNGPLQVATSDRWYPQGNVRIARVFASLKVVGSTATTVELLLNGATVATVTIAAGANVGGTDVSIPARGPEQDYFQMQTTAIGTGAEGLVVQPRLG